MRNVMAWCEDCGRDVSVNDLWVCVCNHELCESCSFNHSSCLIEDEDWIIYGETETA